MSSDAASKMLTEITNTWNKLTENPKRWKLQCSSVYLGWCGFDRFYLRQNILGIVKALSGGGLGIWYLMDMAIQLVESWMRRDHTLARSGIKFVEQDINISYYLASINSIILLLIAIAIPTIIIIAIKCRCDSNDKKTY